MLKNYKPDEEIYILWWDSDLSQQFADTDPLTEDEFDAQSIAEQNFLDEFTCTVGGHDVGFDSVESWDAEEA